MRHLHSVQLLLIRLDPLLLHNLNKPRLYFLVLGLRAKVWHVTFRLNPLLLHNLNKSRIYCLALGLRAKVWHVISRLWAQNLRQRTADHAHLLVDMRESDGGREGVSDGAGEMGICTPVLRDPQACLQECPGSQHLHRCPQEPCKRSGVPGALQSAGQSTPSYSSHSPV